MRLRLSIILIALVASAPTPPSPLLPKSAQCALEELRPYLEREPRELTPELRKQIEGLAVEIVKLADRTIGLKLDLETRLCNAASTCMAILLKEGFRELKIERVMTLRNFGTWREPGPHHTYLKILDYFGPGRDLIIDPTIRQFFKHLPADQLEQIPLVFTGTEAEVRALANKWLPPGMSQKLWIDTYLKARLVRSIRPGEPGHAQVPAEDMFYEVLRARGVF